MPTQAHVVVGQQQTHSMQQQQHGMASNNNPYGNPISENDMQQRINHVQSQPAPASPMSSDSEFGLTKHAKRNSRESTRGEAEVSQEVRRSIAADGIDFNDI